jgi:hypothetical protein
MEHVVLLSIIVLTPILVIGGIQLLTYRLLGFRGRFAVNAVVLVVCAGLLINEAAAPPIYGNKAGLFGLGILAVFLVLMQSLIVLCLPLIRRYFDWQKTADARWVSWQNNKAGSDL